MAGKNAEVAHLVEHDLAKVGVAGSSPVFRSNPGNPGFFYYHDSGRFWNNCTNRKSVRQPETRNDKLETASPWWWNW